jgi:taurine dioxygenase
MSTPPANSVSSLTVRPLTPRIGAELDGVNLAADLDDALFRKIYEAFLQHHVLVFRDQDLPPARQVEFGRRFGEPQIHVLNQFHDSEHPELYLLSNLDDQGQPSGAHPDPGTVYWHTDGSWTERRTIATMLYSIEAPREGGETHIANMYAAYEALDDGMKERLDGLVAIHNLNFSRQRRDPTPLTEDQLNQVTPVEHAIVRVHPDTQRRCIYLGDHAETVVGMAYDEGRALIDELNELIIRSELVYEHHWQARELIVWDNRCALHRASPYDTGSERRVIRRLTVLAGE